MAVGINMFGFLSYGSLVLLADSLRDTGTCKDDIEGDYRLTGIKDGHRVLLRGRISLLTGVLFNFLLVLGEESEKEN